MSGIFDNGSKEKEPMTQADVAYNKMMDPDVQQGWVDEIQANPPDRYTDEDQDFIENCDRRLRAEKGLTEPMAKWLIDIYNRTR